MILYHGSNIAIDIIDLSKSKPNKDADTESNIHDYDIIYGPIANDSVGRQIFNLKEGYIDFDEFMRRLHYMKGITFQYAFCTELAISKLIRI